MPTPYNDDYPSHDDWLEHIDTVVLDREQGAELDRPVDEKTPVRKDNEL